MIRLGYKTLPTHDIYFRVPLSDLIAERLWSQKSRPIRRLGSNVFVAGENLIIIRYLTAKEKSKIAKYPWTRCFYVVDDDFDCLEKDLSLPEDYRNRLMKFRRETLPEILAMADSIVAPNAAIFDAYPGKRHLLLNPSYNSICTDFSHFDGNGPMRILFPGSRSHLVDLEFLSACLREICEEYAGSVTLHTFMGTHAPSELKGLENVINRKASSWQRFKTMMASERYHLCLSPTLDTAFNRARSINKLFDCAAFGAAGLYSACGPIQNAVAHGHSGLIIENQASAWDDTIRQLLKDKKAMRSLAETGAEQAAKLGDPKIVRDFWQRQLGLNEAQ